ncbi:hypothetical protein ES705_04203 [subsurface metagenome]
MPSIRNLNLWLSAHRPREYRRRRSLKVRAHLKRETLTIRLIGGENITSCGIQTFRAELNRSILMTGMGQITRMVPR